MILLGCMKGECSFRTPGGPPLVAALAERRMPSFGSGEEERPWTGVPGPWVYKWRASKEMGLFAECGLPATF